MKPIMVKQLQCWGTSISMLFGKTPKVNMACGKCSYYFARRFGRYDFEYGYRGMPIAVCPTCGQVNYVPIRIGE
ncbi:hypothetical protein [Bacillus stercoris]|uniref:hypothetical protein n=1 Tax=Bacillus stercoris TaxID=2054641 RepID=UPI003CF9F431